MPMAFIAQVLLWPNSPVGVAGGEVADGLLKGHDAEARVVVDMAGAQLADKHVLNCLSVLSKEVLGWGPALNETIWTFHGRIGVAFCLGRL